MRQYILLQQFGLVERGVIFYEGADGYYRTKTGLIILREDFIKQSPELFELLLTGEKRWSDADLRVFADEILNNIGHKTPDEIINKWRAKK